MSTTSRMPSGARNPNRPMNAASGLRSRKSTAFQTSLYSMTTTSVVIATTWSARSSTTVSRRYRTGLWLVGVALAALVFVISTTGEALHWDEVGFAVPWHVSEVLEAVGLAAAFNYTHQGLLTIPLA